jgi:hypothetical protein
MHAPEKIYAMSLKIKYSHWMATEVTVMFKVVNAMLLRRDYAMSLKIKYSHWMATEVTGWAEVFLAHLHTYSLGVGSRG